MKQLISGTVAGLFVLVFGTVASAQNFGGNYYGPNYQTPNYPQYSPYSQPSYAAPYANRNFGYGTPSMSYANYPGSAYGNGYHGNSNYHPNGSFGYDSRYSHSLQHNQSHHRHR